MLQLERRRQKLCAEVRNAAPATLLPPAGAGREPGGDEAQQEDSEGSTGRIGEARGEARGQEGRLQRRQKGLQRISLTSHR